IAQKLEEVLAFDYPKDKLDVMVVSDCSVDRTDEIVRGFESRGVRLLRMEKRGGKIAGYKAAVAQAAGEILVFSDATSRMEPGGLKKLLRPFADPDVGVVAGRLVYIDPKKADIAKGEQTYWSYEGRIKDWEEKIFSLTSVSGTFYGVRKELFPLEMANDLADDLIVVLNCVLHGKRAVLEKEAVCREYAIHADSAEVNKRSRITVQNLRGLFSMPRMMDPFKFGWYAVLIISHKLLRALVPVFLVGVLISNIFIVEQWWMFRLILVAQIGFYMLGALASVWQDKRPRWLNIIYYFCVSNLAILWGIIRFLRGERMATWETAR
ncbi:MAG TPA: glycosyltransferase, partial [Candidatus Omnitrophota bacterium]|nr:glycosyltransferase [Candidatus Omnitrophota bacterium]